MFRSLVILVTVLSWTVTASAATSPFKPDPFITPGDVDRNATTEMVCTVGYSSTVRDVSDKTKSYVFRLYDLPRVKGMYEVDHLVSLQLGGSNSVMNLWPQHYFTQPWNAKVKDALENFLRRQVCDGKMTLQEAQKAIATDWIAAYCKYYNKLPEACATYMEKK